MNSIEQLDSGYLKKKIEEFRMAGGTIATIADRAGLSRMAIYNQLNGRTSMSIGNYVKVLRAIEGP